MSADPPGNKVVALDQRWRRLLRRGMDKLRRGDHVGAAVDIERARAAAPDEPEVLLAVGRQLMRQRHYEQAEPMLRRAFAGLPRSAAAAASLARLLGLHRGRREEAIAIISNFLDDPPDPTAAAALQVVRGELLLEDGSIAAARQAFTAAVDHDLSGAAQTGLARSYNAEGILLSEQDALDKAVFCFKRAADLDPSWSAPLVNLGVALGRLGKLTKALAAYDNALARDPSNPVAYFNLATTHQELGYAPEAAELFEELLELCPDYPGARAALGNVLAEQGQFDRAIAVLLEAIEDDRQSASSWTSLGLAYICTGNAERGEQCLRQALQLDPNYFNAYYNLASLYAAQHRYDEAERILREALARHPSETAKAFIRDSQFDGIRELARFSFLPGEE